MQIILMEKVVNLGGLGDVVKVKDGFARNFLIPQGKAKRATAEEPQGVRGAAAPISRRRPTSTLASAQERAAKLEGMKIDIAQKAGVDGRLLRLRHQRRHRRSAAASRASTVKKAEIRMPQGPLKHIGEFPITIQLHSDVLANITVHVVPEP